MSTIYLVINAKDEQGWSAKITADGRCFIVGTHVMMFDLIGAIYAKVRAEWPGRRAEVTTCVVKDGQDCGYLAKILQSKFDGAGVQNFTG